MNDYAALIAELNGYAERNTVDGRSDSTREAIRLIRAASDALATARAELVKSDRAFSKLKEQHAASDVALVDAKAEIVLLNEGLENWEHDS